MSTQIYLSSKAPTDNWQSDNVVQFVGDDVYVVVNDDNRFPLRDIQKAARKIDGLGVKSPVLSGDNWTPAQQWAFALGFTCVNKLTSVEFTGADRAPAHTAHFVGFGKELFRPRIGGKPLACRELPYWHLAVHEADRCLQFEQAKRRYSLLHLDNWLMR